MMDGDEYFDQTIFDELKDTVIIFGLNGFVALNIL